MGKSTIYAARLGLPSVTFPPTLTITEMALRMAGQRQRLATERQAESDREASEVAAAAVVGAVSAVSDLDGMVG